MRSPRLILLLIALAMLSSLGLAACGDDDDSSEPAATAETTETAGGQAVKVELGENGAKYFITVDKDTVQTGTVDLLHRQRRHDAPRDGHLQDRPRPGRHCR